MGRGTEGAYLPFPTFLPHNSHTISIAQTHLNHIAGHQDHYIKGIKAIAKRFQKLIADLDNAEPSQPILVSSDGAGAQTEILHYFHKKVQHNHDYAFGRLYEVTILPFGKGDKTYMGCVHADELTKHFEELDSLVRSAAADNSALKGQIIATYQEIGSMAITQECGHKKYFASCEKAFKYLFELSHASSSDAELAGIITQCSNFEHAFPSPIT
jgi:hypothetical protein